MNINVSAFAPSTYTFSWISQKTPSQLLTELCKKKKTAIDICSPVLRRSKPIPIPKKPEEVIEDSTVNHCTNNDNDNGFNFFGSLEWEQP
jgi:hypothetical protein